ncbi:hypothetical protein RYA05_02175 [Pseudomonas syringae pv. actinidiae]|nr:hypothetical protein [Pseudomonas syringae pv. actinidiae]
MNLNKASDIVMSGGVILLLTSCCLMLYSCTVDLRIEKAMEKSPLHHQVLSEFKDVCRKEKPTTICVGEAASKAQIGGYSDKLEGIFTDAHIFFTPEQLEVLHAKAAE